MESWLQHLPRAEGLFYHYTSVEIASMIAESGFKVSDIGMGGRGVYFATQSPVDNSLSTKWPEASWREEMLRTNYGDAWKVRHQFACNACVNSPCTPLQEPSRQNLINAVLVVTIPVELLKTVPERAGAMVMSE